VNNLKCLTSNEMRLVCGGHIDDVSDEEVIEAVEDTVGFAQKLIKGKYISSMYKEWGIPEKTATVLAWLTGGAGVLAVGAGTLYLRHKMKRKVIGKAD
jgi:hypothetical protein